MNQIIFIHWGETFDTTQQYYDFLDAKKYDPFAQIEKRWRYTIEEQCDEFECIAPAMPAKQNADYIAWSIWFEKILPYLNNEKTILIGSSLGGIFLVKYLSENGFPKNIHQLHLVWAVFDESGLIWEWVGNFKIQNTAQLSHIPKLTEKIFLYHSKDDFVVPYEHVLRYLEYFPQAILSSFEDRNHFLQADFPELIENIKNNSS